MAAGAITRLKVYCGYELATPRGAIRMTDGGSADLRWPFIILKAYLREAETLRFEGYARVGHRGQDLCIAWGIYALPFRQSGRQLVDPILSGTLSRLPSVLKCGGNMLGRTKCRTVSFLCDATTTSAGCLIVAWRLRTHILSIVCAQNSVLGV